MRYEDITPAAMRRRRDGSRQFPRRRSGRGLLVQAQRRIKHVCLYQREERETHQQLSKKAVLGHGSYEIHEVLFLPSARVRCFAIVKVLMTAQGSYLSVSSRSLFCRRLGGVTRCDGLAVASFGMGAVSKMPIEGRACTSLLHCYQVRSSHMMTRPHQSLGLI